VYLVYQKLNETKSILELAMQADHFLVEHPVPIHARMKEKKRKEQKRKEEKRKERKGKEKKKKERKKSKTRKNYQRLIHKTQTLTLYIYQWLVKF
jgi:hypothetical protein